MALRETGAPTQGDIIGGLIGGLIGDVIDGGGSSGD